MYYKVSSGGYIRLIEANDERDAVEKFLKQDDIEALGVIIEVQKAQLYFSTEKICRALGLWGEDPTPVCKVCNDTYIMHFEESGKDRMCTHCPVPCQKCRRGGNGPYCENTPCSCDCHKDK